MRAIIEAILIPVFAIAAASGADGACSARQAENDGATLAEVVEELANRTGEWSLESFGPDRFWQNSAYESVASDPCSRLSEAVRLVEARQLNSREEIVIAQLMLRLPLGSYLDWLARVQAARAAGKAGDSLVLHVAFPSTDERPDLYLAFSDPTVASLYREISTEPELRPLAERYLSGETARFVRTYMSQTQTVLPVVEVSKRCRLP
jgi:hypothetical protein